MKKRVLFVAAGPVQRTAMGRVKEMGYEVYAIDENAGAAGFDIATKHEVCDICDPSEIVRVAKKFKVTAIMCVCTDAPLVAVANACAQLGLPGPSVETAEVSTNKWLQRMALRKAGIAVPKFQRFQTVSEAKTIADTFHFPVVLKPTDNAGSRGVTYVNAAAYVESAAQSALNNSKSGFGLIETFMQGPEISVEAFVCAGKYIPLCLSEKVRTKLPYLLDQEVHFPQNCSDDVTSEILEMASAAVKACGFDNCPVHMELIRTADGPRVVEMAARGAGFYVFTRILPYVTGVDTMKISLDLALGNEPHITPLDNPLGASLVFLEPKPGRFVSATFVEEARSLQGIIDIQVYPAPGDELEELRSGADRVGHIFAFASTRMLAEKVALEARRMIQIHVEPTL